MMQITLYLNDIPAALGGRLTQQHTGLNHELFTSAVLTPFARRLTSQGPADFMWALTDNNERGEEVVLALQPFSADSPPEFEFKQKLIRLLSTDKTFQLAIDQVKRIMRCAQLWRTMADADDDVVTTDNHSTVDNNSPVVNINSIQNKEGMQSKEIVSQDVKLKRAIAYPSLGAVALNLSQIQIAHAQLLDPR